MKILGQDIVAIMRHGRVSCHDCIRDSAEHSVWNDALNAADIMQEEGITLLKAADLKQGQKCSRCDQEIKL